MKDLTTEEFIELFQELRRLSKEFKKLYENIYEFQTLYDMPKDLSETIYQCQDHIEELKKTVLADLGYLQILKHDNK